MAEIAAVDGYGFTEADDHRVYFNRASVLGDRFDELSVGTPVAFVDEQGGKGTQGAPSACSANITTSRLESEMGAFP
jgi:hypothetical protein